jgi:hypothetical protein
MSDISLLISTPCKSGFIGINFMMSLLQTVMLLNSKGIKYSLQFDVGKAGIDMPRSMAATYFLMSNHTHLMFIDDDMAWQPELVLRLLEVDRDVVGVPYRQKSNEILYNMRIENGYEQSTENPALLSVNDIATGLLMVKKRVFDALKTKVDWVVDHNTREQTGMFFRHNVVDVDNIAEPTGNKVYMSEDFYFCKLAREAGFQIWAYVDAETAHTGTISFKGNYADILEKVTETKFRDEGNKTPLRLMGSWE